MVSTTCNSSVEPWCLQVIEPSNRARGNGNGLGLGGYGSYGAGEVDEAYQYIIRFWAKNKYETIRIHFNDLTGNPTSAVYLSEARIYATKCYMDEACGLCGYYDGDPLNDFTYRLDYNHAIHNPDLFPFGYTQISVHNAHDAYSQDSWDRMQQFTYEWKSNDTMYHDLRPHCINQPPPNMTASRVQVYPETILIYVQIHANVYMSQYRNWNGRQCQHRHSTNIYI